VGHNGCSGKEVFAMIKNGQGAARTPARPIRTKRDYERASVVVKRLSGQTDCDSAAELRLQALLRAMDKFEDGDDATSADVIEDYGYSGPCRRWSDDTPDAD
jgi:hypothetical protein